MDKKSEQWFRRGAFFVVLSLVVHAFVAWWARTPPDWVPQAPTPVDTVRPPQARTLADALLNPQKEDFKAVRTADLGLDSLTLAADIRSREA